MKEERDGRRCTVTRLRTKGEEGSLRWEVKSDNEEMDVRGGEGVRMKSRGMRYNKVCTMRDNKE